MPRTPLSSPLAVLRHPNVMTEAERLALPDPCAPINSEVVPASQALASLLRDDVPFTDDERLQGVNAARTNPRHQADTPIGLSSDKSFDITQFIQEQQRDSHLQPCKLRLPLSLLPKLVKDAGLAWWEQVMRQHPDLTLTQPSDTQTTTGENTKRETLSQLETRLYLMGQMYHTMLCIFLLCQCKSRKTLNQQVSLQDLTDAINAYIKAHHTELDFLTQQPDMSVELKHVEFAVTVLGWPMSKHSDIGQRHTTISSQNPLTGC